MTASRRFRSCLTTALTLTLVAGATIVGCAAPHRDDLASLAAVSGELLADGSCRVTVNGAPLFAATDHPRASYDAGPVADVAPAGYALHQITCTLADADSTRSAERSSDAHAADERMDERMVIITLYAREGASPSVGRYTIQESLETPIDTDPATRAGVAIFGASADARPASDAAHQHHAGVRYLEGRVGTLSITSVSRGADGERVVGTFNARASPAWSM